MYMLGANQFQGAFTIEGFFFFFLHIRTRGRKGERDIQINDLYFVRRDSQLIELISKEPFTIEDWFHKFILLTKSL
jgi:hypothetical protein